MARVRNLFGQAKDATKREGKAKKSQQKARKQPPVSYTHLTLPTKRIV